MITIQKTLLTTVSLSTWIVFLVKASIKFALSTCSSIWTLSKATLFEMDTLSKLPKNIELFIDFHCVQYSCRKKNTYNSSYILLKVSHQMGH